MAIIFNVKLFTCFASMSVGSVYLGLKNETLFFRDEEIEQAPVQPSLLEAKRWGLSRSALRSHQPVARPILAGLSRCPCRTSLYTTPGKNMKSCILFNS